MIGLLVGGWIAESVWWRAGRSLLSSGIGSTASVIVVGGAGRSDRTHMRQARGVVVAFVTCAALVDGGQNGRHDTSLRVAEPVSHDGLPLQEIVERGGVDFQQTWPDVKRR